MLIVMQIGASKEEIFTVIDQIEINGFHAHPIFGQERTVIGVVGEVPPTSADPFMTLTGVEQVVRVSRAYKLASREKFRENTRFTLRCHGANGDVEVGGESILMIAGPFAVDSRSQALEAAQAVKEAGVHILLGGAFKDNLSPHAGAGMDQAGLEVLAEVRTTTGLPVVVEVSAPDQVPLVATYADVLQIGGHNMQNYALLHAAGESQHPVLIKRGDTAMLEELIMAAEYILSHGNGRVMLCERGIRTFETFSPYTTDINAIPALKILSHLPVLLDPTNSSGCSHYIPAVARAAIAAGADGLIVQVQPAADGERSDGKQSLNPAEYAALVRQVRGIAEAMGRTLPF